MKVVGLGKTFGNLHALRDVNLELATGDFLTIIGPNGAGKTTLIRILSTLMRAFTGTISIGGFSLSQEPQQIRHQIGVIAHQTFLYDELTAVENLKFYGRLYEVPDLAAKIERIIAEVGLGWRRHDRVRTFSRGMQQRLSIARAMIHDPTILLLDEPYTGLDQHAAEMLTGWLSRLKDNKRTTIMVTHDLEKGLELADRVSILHQGRIVFERGAPTLNLHDFRRKYRDLISPKQRRYAS